MIEHAIESGESRVDLWLLPPVTIFSFALLSSLLGTPARVEKQDG
jgi:hypothetical protein